MEHQNEKESQYLTSELRCKLQNWTYTLDCSLTSKPAEYCGDGAGNYLESYLHRITSIFP